MFVLDSEVPVMPSFDFVKLTSGTNYRDRNGQIELFDSGQSAF